MNFKSFIKQNWFWIFYLGISLLIVIFLKFVEIKFGIDYCSGFGCLY